MQTNFFTSRDLQNKLWFLKRFFTQPFINENSQYDNIYNYFVWLLCKLIFLLRETYKINYGFLKDSLHSLLLTKILQTWKYFLQKIHSRKFILAKISGMPHSRKFILAKYADIVHSRKFILAKWSNFANGLIRESFSPRKFLPLNYYK